MTELIEPAFTINDKAAEIFLERMEHELPAMDGIAFCSTLPGKTTPELYRQTAELCSREGKIPLIDSWRDMETVLAAAGEVYLKINCEELQLLTRLADFAQASRSIFERYNIKMLAVTNGVSEAFLTDNRTLYQYHLSKLERIVSPIGSSDTASAVFLSELVNRQCPQEAFAPGLAAASANCLTPICGKFEAAQAQKLRNLITIETTQLQENANHERN